MSRVGLSPVQIPDGVEIKVDGQYVSAKGKLGELDLTIDDEVEVAQEDNTIVVRPRNQTKRARSLWGTSRSLISNIVVGVSEGFQKNLEINGVGYRAQVQGKDLVLQLGHSHEIRYPIPEGINVACERPTHVAISGINRQLVGQVAAEVRAFRKPEPYKGKGVKYENEQILRKEGKKK